MEAVMDQHKLNEFLGRFVSDLGATIAAGSTVIGHRLGLYRALAVGPATPEELAARTDCDDRYVTEWLRAGANVADVGCGLGASTLLLAEHYPNSRFVGSDQHAASIEIARKRAADAGASDRVTFE